MALSNMKNEPRREIIEHAVGIIAIAAFLVADYALVRWIGAQDTATIAVGMFIGAAMFPLVVMVLTVGVHAVGELVCAVLGALGFDPRPKRRY